jgi:hypothetical protein
VSFYVSFRLADIPPKSNGERSTYDDYFAEVKRRTGLGPSVMSARNFGLKVTNAFRQHLAKALLQLEPRSRDNTAESDEQVDNSRTSGSPYVPRATLEAQLRELYAQGEKLIMLIGQPGMGKTWLAREIAHQVGGAEVPLIQVFEKKPHLPDVIFAMRACGIDFTSDASPIEHLALLLCADQAPPIVIIDNLENADELRWLLPEQQTRATVIATARVKGTWASERAQFVTVGPMTRAEAQEAIKRRVPNLKGRDADDLIHELHGHPLILRHAGTLLAHGGLSAHELVRSLRAATGTAASVGRMPTEGGMRLSAVLTHLTEALADEDELAHELLILLIFVRYGGPSLQFLFAYAREV